MCMYQPSVTCKTILGTMFGFVQLFVLIFAPFHDVRILNQNDDNGNALTKYPLDNLILRCIASSIGMLYWFIMGNLGTCTKFARSERNERDDGNDDERDLERGNAESGNKDKDIDAKACCCCKTAGRAYMFQLVFSVLNWFVSGMTVIFAIYSKNTLTNGSTWTLQTLLAEKSALLWSSYMTVVIMTMAFLIFCCCKCPMEWLVTQRDNTRQYRDPYFGSPQFSAVFETSPSAMLYSQQLMAGIVPEPAATTIIPQSQSTITTSFQDVDIHDSIHNIPSVPSSITSNMLE